jgi:hypothetical protein
MTRPAEALLQQLTQARGPEDPDERHERRQEILLMVLILISQELEFASDALTRIAASVQTGRERVDTALAALMNENGADTRLPTPNSPKA